jgi:hypothetical protein
MVKLNEKAMLRYEAEQLTLVEVKDFKISVNKGELSPEIRPVMMLDW